jgi:LysM repeat protein
MNHKRVLRTSIFCFLGGLIVIGLASCQLPASNGPQSTSETNDGFPIPGNTATPGGINVSIFATQTAQARSRVVIPTSNTNPYPPATSVIPLITATPSELIPTATSVLNTPAAQVTYVTATPGGPPATYTLAEGEFIYCIARRFNVDVNELLTLNGLTLDSLLSPGTELKIPQTGDPFIGTRVLHEHPTTYKVQTDDTLNRIACYFGDVSPDMIALQNGLTSYTDLPVGKTLVIP